MNAPHVIEQPTALPAVACSEWLGEQWTHDELYKAKHVMSAVYEGVDVNLTIEEMRELEKRGLVTDIKVKPGRGRYAGRYGFEWTDKLEELVKAVRTSSPNDKMSHRPPQT